MNFHFISLKENILEKVISENQNTNSLFIFPTFANKKKAIALHQKSWNLSETDFMSMEELKENCFISQYPLIKEDKRKLMLYLSLNKEQKDFLNIHNYFQSIKFANNFFDFWEEVGEELIPPKRISNFLLQDNSLSWKINFFEHIINIKKEYEKILHERQLADKIFVYQPSNWQFNKSYDKIIVVNQFYYTELEKWILAKLQNINIYYQIPETCLDKKELKINSFSIKDLKRFKTESIIIKESQNSFSMIMALMQDIKNISTVIDFKFLKQSYAKFFSKEKFKLPTFKKFVESSIYSFVFHLQQLIDNIILVKGKYYISVQILLEACHNQVFIKYFLQNVDSNDDLLEYLDKLMKNDYLYIDLDYKFFYYLQPKDSIKELLQKIISLLNELINYKNFTECINFLSKMKLKKILNEEEKNYSDVIPVYFESLTDFSSLSNFFNTSDWKNIFESNYPNLPINQFLKLFLEHLKYKKIKFITKDKENCKINIQSLQATRNNTYKSVAFLNLSEGILPQSKQSPFLLSENQRAVLGLKTYNEIKLRDKYYFYRTLANSKYVFLYTIKNTEKNITPSSYLEELKLQLDSGLITTKDDIIYPIKPIYEELINLTPNQIAINEQIVKEPEFYKFLLVPKLDYPKKQISLTHYRWLEMKKNPFMYYLKNLLKLEPKEIEKDYDFSARIIGKIAHQVFSEYWNSISLENNNNYFMIKNFYDEQRFQKIIKKIINSQEFQYHSPHNYANVYFKKFFADYLEDGLKFFMKGLTNKIDASKVKIIPENKPFTKKNRVLIKKHNNIPDIKISGRADLIIETKNYKYIFDYKTGNSRKKSKFYDQLLLYEFLYYLIKNPRLKNNVISYLYFIEESLFIDLSGKDKRIKKWLKDIMNTIDNIWKNGFYISTKSDLYEPIEITRKDLYLKNNLDFWE